jgi:hypothetical protein
MFERPPRLILTNLDTQQQLRAQFNPEELSLAIKPVYNKMVIPGMSHTLRQFSHTDDLTLSFELKFHVIDPKGVSAARSDIFSADDAFGEDAADGDTERFTIAQRVASENFILALAIPRGDGSVITRNAPPSVLVVWPNFLSFEAILVGADFKYTRFNAKGHPVEFTVGTQWEEFRDMRYTSGDALAWGFQRPRPGKVEL